jgi:hypothetical protein
MYSVAYAYYSWTTTPSSILWRDGRCAVVVHDRQGSEIGQNIAVGSRNGQPVGRSQYIAQNTQNGVASTVTNVV